MSIKFIDNMEELIDFEIASRYKYTAEIVLRERAIVTSRSK